MWKRDVETVTIKKVTQYCIEKEKRAMQKFLAQLHLLSRCMDEEKQIKIKSPAIERLYYKLLLFNYYLLFRVCWTQIKVTKMLFDNLQLLLETWSLKREKKEYSRGGHVFSSVKRIASICLLLAPPALIQEASALWLLLLLFWDPYSPPLLHSSFITRLLLLLSSSSPFSSGWW